MKAAILLLGLCACGSGDTTVNGSCDTRAVNDACSEYAGPSSIVAQYKTQCPAGSTWKDALCDHSGTVGGCRNSDATLKLTYTNWFFAPQTTATVMANCTAPSTYVAP
jgi:hypothetical protein